MKQKTGIALFVYNRPEHTEKVLNGLKKNNINKLFIFADGAKINNDKNKIYQVNKLIESIDWCKTEIIKSKYNKGLANSIVDGVNYVFENHERIIVLEDDCVPSKDFISFMNTCFDKYEKNEQIMNITGYAPPIKIQSDYLYDVAFSFCSSSWGWGTWKRAWQYYNRNPTILQEIDNSRSLRYKVDRAGKDLYPMLKSQIEGNLDSWSIFWTINIIKNNGLCINPINSRINNIGHDGSGIHCSLNNRYNVKIKTINNAKIIFPDNIELNKQLIKKYRDFRVEPFFKKVIRFCINKIFV